MATVGPLESSRGPGNYAEVCELTGQLLQAEGSEVSEERRGETSARWFLRCSTDVMFQSCADV